MWIKWLGEVVWRIAGWPADVRENSQDEHFWFLTYGIGGLLVSLVTGVVLVGQLTEPFSELVAMAATYTGADKLLAQGYIGAIMVLLLGVPAVIIGVFMLAIVITILTTLGLMFTRGVVYALVWLLTKVLEKLLPRRWRAPVAGALLGAGLGYAFGAWLENSKARTSKPPETDPPNDKSTPPV